MLCAVGRAAEGSLTVSLTPCECSLVSEPGSASSTISVLQALHLRVLGLGKSPKYAYYVKESDSFKTTQLLGEQQVATRTHSH